MILISLLRTQLPFIFLKLSFYFIVCLCLSICMCAMFMQELEVSRVHLRSFGTGVTGRWELPCRCWGQNPGPLQEQYAFLTFELSPLPSSFLRQSFTGVWRLLIWLGRLLSERAPEIPVSASWVLWLPGFCEGVEDQTQALVLCNKYFADWVISSVLKGLLSQSVCMLRWGILLTCFMRSANFIPHFPLYCTLHSKCLQCDRQNL